MCIYIYIYIHIHTHIALVHFFAKANVARLECSLCFSRRTGRTPHSGKLVDHFEEIGGGGGGRGGRCQRCIVGGGGREGGEEEGGAGRTVGCPSEPLTSWPWSHTGSIFLQEYQKLNSIGKT